MKNCNVDQIPYNRFMDHITWTILYGPHEPRYWSVIWNEIDSEIYKIVHLITLCIWCYFQHRIRNWHVLYNDRTVAWLNFISRSIQHSRINFLHTFNSLSQIITCSVLQIMILHFDGAVTFTRTAISWLRTKIKTADCKEP